MTEEEFAAKVDYEGGVFDALEYGLKANELPEGELKKAWQRLEDAFLEVQRPLAHVEDIIGELLDGLDEDVPF